MKIKQLITFTSITVFAQLSSAASGSVAAADLLSLPLDLFPSLADPVLSWKRDGNSLVGSWSWPLVGASAGLTKALPAPIRYVKLSPIAGEPFYKETMRKDKSEVSMWEWNATVEVIDGESQTAKDLKKKYDGLVAKRMDLKKQEPDTLHYTTILTEYKKARTDLAKQMFEFLSTVLANKEVKDTIPATSPVKEDLVTLVNNLKSKEDFNISDANMPIGWNDYGLEDMNMFVKKLSGEDRILIVYFTPLKDAKVEICCTWELTSKPKSPFSSRVKTEV
jgi:hypothetical protein